MKPPGGAQSPRGAGSRGSGGARRTFPPRITALLLAAALVAAWMFSSKRAAQAGSGTQVRAPSPPPRAALNEVAAARDAGGTLAVGTMVVAASENRVDAGAPAVVKLVGTGPAHTAAAQQPGLFASLPHSSLGGGGSGSRGRAASVSGGDLGAGAVASSGGRAEAPAPQGQVEQEECRPSLIVVLTSHKTGTAQARCITEMLEQRYLMQGAARHDHHPPHLHAAAEFAAERLQTQLSGAAGGSGGLYCPSVKLYSSGHHLPRLEDEACPGTLPCPCEGQQERCLSTEAGTIDIPGGSTTVVQVIRNPIDAVLSAYEYHTQTPAPEEWLEQMLMQNMTGWLYSGGVPYDALDALGAFHQALPADSFYSFLRRLPQERGVKLQWWMSSWELYGFARQYASLAVQPGLRFVPLRFEDLQSRFNATARVMLEAFAERLPQLGVEQMLAEVQACHVSSWDHALLASHTHVTNRHPALRRHLRGVLMGDPEIAGRLCQLSAVFGYAPEVPECGGDGGGSGAAAAAGAGQQQGEEEGQAPVDKSRH
ncbi:hypothetical protein CHLNCDRAFT_132983 [Chlorella variabilis]|uniref:Sulfotransferase n=1 Tax=Chlorella variabilis TaxID=554065 RepID=E1Z233_CHLVA|nr:hypothetical protein CHLNCDRAFT_132983 [Chlorella variabilis]EFN59595.1 hypothetical protein CHLNCDRAFT_132983 [Chlorella variabilis]|eukprot:XP_005851697.1 hypothetical protein CHLNCDRAFT_132983 [Chlorella variabilis]